MNIAIDIDDTITNTYEYMLPLIAVYYNVDLKKLWKDKPTYKEMKKIFPNFEEFIKDNFHILANIVTIKDNAIEILKKLRNEGHKIIIITSRNTEEYGNPYKISYDFLTKNGVPFDKLYTNVDNKGQKCLTEGIDLFLDDNTKNCKSAIKYGIKTCQFTSLSNSADDKIEKVSTWKDFYNLVHNIEL